MAMINCPECGRPVSDRARQCPGCGYPIRELYTPAAAPEQPAEEPVIQEPVYEPVYSEPPKEAYEPVYTAAPQGEYEPVYTAAPAQPVKPEKHRRRGGIIAICLVVFMALTVIIFGGKRCAEDGCREKVRGDGLYCYDHTCIEPGCDAYRPSWESYCYLHEWSSPSYDYDVEYDYEEPAEEPSWSYASSGEQAARDAAS